MKINLEKGQKKERIIDLTDTGRRNKQSFVRRRRELVTDPDTGTEYWQEVPLDVSQEDFENGQWLRRRNATPNKVESTEGDNAQPFILVANNEDRMKNAGMPTKQEHEYEPQDIEPGYEEGLENRGATVINSTTYYPASGITTHRRSMTHDEIADERGYHDFYEPH